MLLFGLKRLSGCIRSLHSADLGESQYRDGAAGGRDPRSTDAHVRVHSGPLLTSGEGSNQLLEIVQRCTREVCCVSDDGELFDTEVSDLIRKAIRSLVWLVLLPVAAVVAPSAQGQTAAEFSAWLYQYSSGDLRADYSGDGLLTPADFNAFLLFHATPTQTTGWTDLSPSAGTRQIFVSPRGSDSNSGLSQSRPVRTIGKAYSLMRNGRPDWMLLERGAIFNESFPSWRKSGRSASEPMVVTTYGPGSQRPKIRTGSSSGLISADNQVRRHLRFVGLEIFPHTRSNEVPAGVSFVGPVDDILIEDFYVHGFANGILFQASDDSRGSNVTVRRSIIADNWAMSQHAQGLFFRSIDNVSIEECVIDQNGWLPQLEAQTRTIFNHNVYIQRDVTGLRFVDNFVSRGSSHGLQARNGGTVERNVFWENPISILWGNEGGTGEVPVRGTVSNNVLLDAIDMHDQPRGWGILIENVERGRVDQNILAGSTSSPFSSWGIGIGGPDRALVRNLTIEGNVFYNWYNGFTVLRRTAEDIDVVRNTFTTTRSNEVLIDHRVPETEDNVDYLGNRYYQSDSTTRWFAFNYQELNLNEWRRDFDPQAQAIPNPTSYFPNSRWTLDTYASGKGYSNAEALVGAMRGQRRAVWNNALTTRSIVGEARVAFGLPTLP